MLDPADRTARGFNPLCGDRVTVYLRTAGNDAPLPSGNRQTLSHPPVIAGISFEAAGCAICLASASMMTELLEGQTESGARRHVEQILAAFQPDAQGGLEGLGDIEALGSVRAYPARIRCVTLPWQTLTAALDGEARPAS